MTETKKISFKEFTEKFFVISSFLMIASLLWGIEVAVKFVLLWEFSWIVMILSNRKTISFKIDNLSLKILFIVSAIYFLLHIIGLLYSHNMHSAIQNIMIKIHILLIPIIIISTYKIIKKHIYSLLNIFVFSTFLSSVVLIIVAFVKSLHFEAGELIFQSSLREGYSFFQSILWPGNNFFYFHFSIFNHPSYMAALVLIAIAILLFIRVLPNQNKNIIDKIIEKNKVKIFLIIYLTLIVMMLMSKANYLIIFAIFFFYFLTLKIKLKNKIGILIIWSFFSIFIIAINPRYQVFFKNFVAQLTNKKTEQVASGTARLLYWERSFEIIQNNFWTGVGTGDVNDMMVNKKNQSLDSLHNIHNEYIETFVRLGIFGEITFLMIFFLLIINATKNKNYFLISILLIVYINFFFESMLDRVTGVFLTGVFLSLAPIAGLNRDYKNEESEIENSA